MPGPLDLSQAELARYELAALWRGLRSGEPIIRVYCVRCGRQVNLESRETDPDRWWACARGCNTLYAEAGRIPRPRPVSPVGRA